jgi:rifampicin phosphotransferase
LYIFSERMNRKYTAIKNASWPEVRRDLEKLFVFSADFLRIVDVPVYYLYTFEKDFYDALIMSGMTSKDFDVLTYPLYNSYHKRRKIDMLLLKEGAMSIREFIEKWNWSETAIFEFIPVDQAFVDQQINHLVGKIDDLAERDLNAIREYNPVYARLKKKLKAKADIAQMLIKVRDQRMEYYTHSLFNLRPLLMSASELIGIKYEQMIYMTPDEILERKAPDDITLRMERYSYTPKGILVGKASEEFSRRFEKHLDIGEVRGKGVSLGIVKGTAKVVNTKSELVKIKEGDIIVCDITTPDYVHALHKVKAIVANIGGFTSHSAIVAREFGIPCVVGCGNATLVFNDGDIIEVDADNGIVRKLS